jgi:hypothetical protein
MDYEHFMRLVLMVCEIMDGVKSKAQSLENVSKEEFERARAELKAEIILAGLLLLVLKESI